MSSLKLATRADMKSLGSAGPIILNIYLYTHLIANLIGLPILAAIFTFSKTAKRHPTLINVCIVWIISGVDTLLLFFRGYGSYSRPPKHLCTLQASLLYGVTPMWGMAILMLVLNLTILTRGGRTSGIRLFIMLVAPYITQMIFSFACMMIAFHNPREVARHWRYFYCTIKNSPLSIVTNSFNFGINGVTTMLEAYLGIRLYRTWKASKRIGRTIKLDFHVLLRVLVFGLYIWLGMAISVSMIFNNNSAVPDLYAATIGPAILVIFGSQHDVISVLCFWRRAPPKPLVPMYLSRESDEYLSERPHLLDLTKLIEKTPPVSHPPPVYYAISRVYQVHVPSPDTRQR